MLGDCRDCLETANDIKERTGYEIAKNCQMFGHILQSDSIHMLCLGVEAKSTRLFEVQEHVSTTERATQ